MAKKPPAFQFYAKDWLASASVRSMEWAARGLYIELLALCWDNEGLPSDQALLRRMVGMEAREWRRLWPQVAPSFVHRGAMLINIKLQEIRAEMTRISEERAKAGRAGGLAPHEQTPSKQDSKPPANDEANGVAKGQPAFAVASATPSERQKQFAHANRKDELPGSDRRRSEGQGMAHIGAPLEAIAARLANAKPAA